MRNLISSAFVALMLLVGIVPVQAQGVGILGGGYMPSSPEGWYYYLTGNQVMMLQADNLNMVSQFMNQGRRAQMRRVTDDLVGYGPYVGLNGPQGFYPMYQCSSTRRRWERGIGTTLITTAIGAAVGGGKRGAAIGAAVGGGYALYKDSSCRTVQNSQIQVVGLDPDNQTMVVQPPMSSQMPSGRENGWDNVLRNQKAGGAYQRGQVGGRSVNNRTGLDVILWVGDSEVPLLIARGGHEQVPRNPGGMEAETIKTAPGGVELRRPALVVPNHDLDGWDIVVPAGR